MELEAHEIRVQIARLLGSKTMSSSEIHRKLLSYLAEKALAGEAGSLKEYTVALEAFGKPSTYDPRHDSIVRLQLGRLRLKLAQYYQAEGPGDPIVVSLPRGFQLHFETLDAHRQAARGHTPTPWGHRMLAAGLVGVLLTAWAGYATWEMVRLRSQARAALSSWTPELEELWHPILKSGPPVVLCIGTPLFAYVPPRVYFRDQGANQWTELEESPAFDSMRKALGNPEVMPWYGYTGTGEANAAFLLGKLLATRLPEILLTRSDILSWQQISDNSLIFIGPPKFNPQLNALPAARDIVMDLQGIRIRNPRPGEPSYLADGPDETHALITLMPGVTGRGELLILAGNASADTHAAAQWLTRPDLAKQLVNQLRLPSKKLPRHYQVVLDVKFRNGIPVQSSYVLHRVISP